MSNTHSVPTHVGSLYGYLQFVFSRPFIKERDQERALILAFQETGDREAFRQLVESHLRLVVSEAKKYCPRPRTAENLSECVSVGNVGLVYGIIKFDLKYNIRLSTYVTWWIKAEIKKHVMENASCVRRVTTKEGRSLFWNLNAFLKERGLMYNRISREALEDAAKHFGVSIERVEAMLLFLRGDSSLNIEKQSASAGDSPGTISTPQDSVEDETCPTEADILKGVDIERMRIKLPGILKEALTDRERIIILARKYHDKDRPETLESLGARLGNISKERVRQIEVMAMEKLTEALAPYRELVCT